MSVAGPPGEWTDHTLLRQGQYRDPTNLQARQSIYAFQRPAINLADWVLDRIGLAGTETVADVGCGNGPYLVALQRRGHRGPRLGADLSEGMVRAAAVRATGAAVSVADAATLPLRDASIDVVLAMHMLYHLPDRMAGAREFARVLSPNGIVAVVLNGSNHLRQLRTLLDALPRFADPIATLSRFDLDAGEELLGQVFAEVRRYEVEAELMLPSSDPVVDYVLSMNLVQAGVVEEAEAISVVKAAVEREIERDGAFRVSTHSGCLICRSRR